MYHAIRMTNEYLTAGNVKAPVHMLKELGRSPAASVRARVAENAATPIGTLLQLLYDADSEVRLSLHKMSRCQSYF